MKRMLWITLRGGVGGDRRNDVLFRLELEGTTSSGCLRRSSLDGLACPSAPAASLQPLPGRLSGAKQRPRPANDAGLNLEGSGQPQGFWGGAVVGVAACPCVGPVLSSGKECLTPSRRPGARAFRRAATGCESCRRRRPPRNERPASRSTSPALHAAGLRNVDSTSTQGGRAGRPWSGGRPAATWSGRGELDQISTSSPAKPLRSGITKLALVDDPRRARKSCATLSSGGVTGRVRH
jgi:hypothetical protein